MINYSLSDDDLVRGRDIREIIEEVNSNEILSDNSTILVTKNEGGTSVSVIDQYGGGAGETTVTSTNPWVITTEIIDEIPHIRIGSGNVYTGEELETVKRVPSDALDVSEYVDGDKLLVYTDIPISRVDDELKLITTPSVIPSTEDPNFRVFKKAIEGWYNNTTSTFERIYSRVGEIEVKAIEGTSPVELEYIVTQVLDEHIKIPSLVFEGFSVFGFPEKDIEAQHSNSGSYLDVFCVGGYYQLPDYVSGELASVKATLDGGSGASDLYFFLHVSSTVNPNTGGYENWSIELINGDYFGYSDAEDIYYPIGNSFRQDFTGSFLSPSRIW